LLVSNPLEISSFLLSLCVKAPSAPNGEFIIIIFLLSRLSLELSGFQLGEERWISLPFKDYCEYKVLKGVK
jgi:hypothetical protein